MMVSKEEMVDVLKTAAVSSFFFVPVCILLLGSSAGLIKKTLSSRRQLLTHSNSVGYSCHVSTVREFSCVSMKRCGEHQEHENPIAQLGRLDIRTG